MRLAAGAGGVGADAAALECDVVDPRSGNVKMLG